MIKRLQFVIPIIALLVINLIYFYPVLQGKVLEQGDILSGKGMGQSIKEYRAATGEEPLWTQAMFSGMPTFQITTRYPANWLADLQIAFEYIGGHASGIYIIFSLMLGFYLLMIALKMNPWLSFVAALAFAFSAFFIISYGAGHNSKVRTAAYIAPIILGVLLTYQRKYLAGFAITAFFVGLSINSNHFQITYYLGLLLLVIAIVELIFAVKEKTLNNFWKASGLLILAAILGIGPNISRLWSTYEYTAESMRGGSSELSSMKESEGGLTFEYAMNWSYGIGETFNLIIPNFSGGGMSQNYEGTEMHDQYFKNIVGGLTQRGTPRAQAEQQANQYLGSMFYWGDQSLVNGAYYVGAIVFFLFVLGFFIVNGRIRWWVAAATLLAVMMAWGKYFHGFNEFLFENLPIYNKFRVPSMAFVIVFFTRPFLGFLGVGKILSGNYDKEKIKQNLLYSLYISGGLCLFFIVLGSAFFDFTGPRDSELAEQGIDVGLLQSDRIALMRKSAFKTLIFCALTFGLLWLYINQKLKPKYMIAVLGVLVIVDQWSFVKQHLNADDFVSERAYKSVFIKSPADETILKDNDPHYRVFNTTAGITSDAFTSYYHKSIGGYHGAKLIRYQDLIEHQLTKQNMACFNMLNAKWFIVGREGGAERAQLNNQACGNSWFVNNIRFVPNADAEMAALSDFDPHQTAIVDQYFKDAVPATLAPGTVSTIELTSYDPKHMIYEANVKSQEQFAVFSEIYYEGGNNDWKTYIDGKESSHIRVNYLLRGMTIPQGQHIIEFKFHPRSYYLGEKISLVFSIILFLLLGITAFLYFKKRVRE